MVDLRQRNMSFRLYERLLIAENKWRAVRYGLEGKLLDFGMEVALPAPDLIRELLTRVEPYAPKLNIEDELAHAHKMLERGSSAEQQLHHYHTHGQDTAAVVDFLGGRNGEFGMIERPSLTIGIEEEYQIIDPETRELRSFITQFIENDRVIMVEREIKPELHQSMVELGTPVCTTVAEAHEELVKQRSFISRLAREKGLAIMCAGTHPFSRWIDQQVTPFPRYLGVLEEMQLLAQRLLDLWDARPYRRRGSRPCH